MSGEAEVVTFQYKLRFVRLIITLVSRQILLLHFSKCDAGGDNKLFCLAFFFVAILKVLGGLEVGTMSQHWLFFNPSLRPIDSAPFFTVCLWYNI